MKAILISDHAKWCALMMNGDKTIEFRKSKTLATAIQKLIDEYGYADIYVYCSKDDDLGCIKKLSKDKYVCGREFDINDFNYLSSGYNGKGKVVFKFRCYKMEEIDVRLGHPKIYVGACVDDLWCLDNGYHDKNYMVRAIHISNLEIFDIPKRLSEFRLCCSSQNHFDEYSFKCLSCKAYCIDMSQDEIWCSERKLELTKAPQNFCYVEELL